MKYNFLLGQENQMEANWRLSMSEFWNLFEQNIDIATLLNHSMSSQQKQIYMYMEYTSLGGLNTSAHRHYNH